MKLPHTVGCAKEILFILFYLCTQIVGGEFVLTCSLIKVQLGKCSLGLMLVRTK